MGEKFHIHFLNPLLGKSELDLGFCIIEYAFLINLTIRRGLDMVIDMVKQSYDNEK